MKTIEIQLKDIKPNPFKKFINGGKLNEFIISRLVEGYRQTKFHVNFHAREDNGRIELVYGHHRLEAAIRYYGGDYVIKLPVYDKDEFSDEDMLIDMVRENLTHRDVDFQDKKEAVVLAYNWLHGKFSGVKRFDTVMMQRRNKNGRFRPTEDSYRSVAKFLSNQGKTISYESVRNYLNIAFNLDEEILNKMEKMSGYTNSRKQDKIPLWQGGMLAGFEDKKEQKDLFKQFQKSREQRRDKMKTHLYKYKQAPEPIKKRIREQKIDIADISSEMNQVQSIDDMKLERTARNVANDILSNYSSLTNHINEIIKEMNIKDLDKELLNSLITSTGVLVKITIPKLLNKLIEYGGKPDKQILELMKILK